MRPMTERTQGGLWQKGWRRFMSRARPWVFGGLIPHPSVSPGSVPHTPVPRKPAHTTVSDIDPVALTILAVDRIGSARLRTGFHGVPVTVAAPNEQIAEIFRAALSEMAKLRPTDRLISVELVADAASPEPSLPGPAR